MESMQNPNITEESFSTEEIKKFQYILANNDHDKQELSNVLDSWSLAPIYCVSRKEQTKRRDSNGVLQPISRTYTYQKKEHTLTIYPAQILQEERATYFYPSAREELIEEALRKIALEQHCGFFNTGMPDQKISGVMFSIYMIRKELKARKHTLSFQQIMESLEILSGCIIDVRSNDGSKLFRSPILPQLVGVSAKRLSEDPKAKWVAYFNQLMTDSIANIEYRQFNYQTYMSLKTQLSRWIYKRLSIKYTYASMFDTYSIMHSTIKNESGLLDNYARSRDEFKKVSKAIDELKSHQVLRDCKIDNSDMSARGKLLNSKYIMLPTESFIKAMKASNKKQKLIRAG